ncbi:radical SAM/SPASM domain-containing protein [Colwellia ponticola]|uniref:Radical SAM protein n=1 Tax=Colwellia ponticola TaxID=2304625 RepID=A0A8H2JKZ8_9GAMM|nr:radical SAM protein [Colwellia ponticola]TMM45385.1 radical SAM protein [Colwellia ponticola]
MNNHQGRFQLEQTYLLLTRKCNLSCSHCIRSSNPSFTEMIDIDLAFQIISQLSLIRKEAVILISGGEPTLHPSFYEIVEKSAKSFRKVVVNTNGLRFSQLKRVADFENVSIQISLDGDEKTHNGIRGEGTFKKTLININKLFDLGINVTIASTVTRHNLHSFNKLDHALSQINFLYWNVKRVVGSGRADDGDDVITPEWNKFVSKIKYESTNSRRLRIAPMFSETAIYNSANTSKESKNSSLLAQNCGTGRSKLYINPNGTVYPCACMEENITGDFKINTTDEILNGLSTLPIKPKLEATCHTCPAWELCHGGCPGASSRARFPNLGDPRCSNALKSIIHYEI